MKKKILNLIVCFIVMAFLLCACYVPIEHGNAPEMNVFTENSQETVITSEQSPNPLPSPDYSEFFDLSSTPEWVIAYFDLVESRDYAKDDPYCLYALVYVDGDDIPELYLSGRYEADGDRIYSYKNGRLVEQYMNRIGGGRYIERSGWVMNQNGHMGRCYTSIFTLGESGFTQHFTGVEDEHVTWTGDDYQFSYEYKIDGNIVSEDAYNAAIKALFDLERSKEFYDAGVSYDTIKQQLIDWK